MRNLVPSPGMSESLKYGDHRHRMTVCLSHRLKNINGKIICSNPWCLTEFQGDLPKPNKWKDVRVLLDGIVDSRKNVMYRKAEGDPLGLDGVQSWAFDRRVGLLVADLGLNKVTISGRRLAGRRTFSINGDTPPTAVNSIGLDNNVNNPVDATDQMDTTSANRSILGFDAGYGTVTGAGVSPVKVVGRGTWTELTNPGPKTFVVRRIAMMSGTGNAAGDLYSIIGGTTPTSILVLDYTGLTTFTLKQEVEVTLSDQSAQ